jgi:hypothetical protein
MAHSPPLHRSCTGVAATEKRSTELENTQSPKDRGELARPRVYIRKMVRGCRRRRHHRHNNEESEKPLPILPIAAPLIWLLLRHFHRSFLLAFNFGALRRGCDCSRPRPPLPGGTSTYRLSKFINLFYEVPVVSRQYMIFLCHVLTF